MPNSTTGHAKYIAQLGRAVKVHRNPGEQFCAFAFDLDTQQLEPSVSSRARADCLDLNGGAPPPTWLAAFFADTDPDHTERAVLDIFDQWYSYYSSTYGAPERLYIYSFLIPCQRDDHHGHCAGAIASQLLALKQRGIELAIHVGWSNNDVDLDMAGATRDDMWDLHDDGIDITVYKVSAAGR
jgi:hypothetical protein